MWYLWLTACPVATVDVFESRCCFFYPENETCNLKAPWAQGSHTVSPHGEEAQRDRQPQELPFRFVLIRHKRTHSLTSTVIPSFRVCGCRQ